MINKKKRKEEKIDIISYLWKEQLIIKKEKFEPIFIDFSIKYSQINIIHLELFEDDFDDDDEEELELRLDDDLDLDLCFLSLERYRFLF